MSGSDGGFDPEMSVEEQAARMVVSDTDGLAKRVAEMGGRSYGVSHLTPDTELWAWTFPDATIDEAQLAASGMPQSEIDAHKYPLRSQLMTQAGRTFKDQAGYYRRMEERRLRAEEAGRTPKPPTRVGGIGSQPFVPVKEI